MKKLIQFLLLSIFFTYNIQAQNYRICTWLDNKSAAVSNTFDDNLVGQYDYADTIMSNRGIKSTFFVVTQGNSPNWTKIINAKNRGHEMASGLTTDNGMQSVTSNYTNFTYSDLALKNSRDTLNNRFGANYCVAMLWPSGQLGNSTISRATLKSQSRSYYIGARAASAGGKGFEYPGTGFFYEVYRFPAMLMAPAITSTRFGLYLDSAIIFKGWFVPLFHDIQNGGYNSIPSTQFRDFMNEIKNRNANLWIAPFGTVMKYHRERGAASLSTIEDTPAQLKLNLTDTLYNDSAFNHPITIRLFKGNCANVTAVTQNSMSMSFVNDGDTIQFNAIPDKGTVIIDRSICTTLDKENLKSALKFSPNPFKDFIQINTLDKSYSSIELIDLQGKSLEKVKNVGINTVLQLGQNLTKGIYLLKSIENSTNLTQISKVVKD